MIGQGAVELHTNSEMPRPGGGGRPRQGHYRPRSGHRCDHAPQRRCRGAGHRGLRQRLQSLHLRAGAPTSPPAGAPTSAAPASPILATRRFTRRAFRSAATTSRSSRSCPNRCATMVASGSRRKRKTCGRIPPPFRSPTAIITSSAFIRPSAICRPRDVASRAAMRMCDEGRGVGETGLGVYLDFSDAIRRLGEPAVREALWQLVRHLSRNHRGEAPTRRRCGFSRRCTTPWAVSGWTIT